MQGKPLSYNNLNDSDAAYDLINEFKEPTIAIIKHANPCGVSSKKSICEAWESALRTDPQSAFGGIVASNKEVTEELAKKIHVLEMDFFPKIIEDLIKVLSDE